MAPILIGASGTFSCSPLVPLSKPGSYQVKMVGLNDTQVRVLRNSIDEIPASEDGSYILESPCTVTIVNVKPGTEKAVIFADAEHLERK